MRMDSRRETDRKKKEKKKQDWIEAYIISVM